MFTIEIEDGRRPASLVLEKRQLILDTIDNQGSFHQNQGF